jgi:hypothetical protein
MFGHRITLKTDDTLDADHAAAIVFAPVAMDDRGVVRLTLNVTKAGTGTLDVTLQTGETEAGPWRTLGTFAQATGVSSERKCFAGADRFVRASCAIAGGAPAFRFSIAGDAV